VKWARQHTLIAGLALVGLTNAVALGGIAYNRSGEPESTLSLTERELRSPYVWTGRKENSGLALRLEWRVLVGDGRNIGPYRLASYGGGIPAWLDAPKMASLGFDVKLSTESPDVNRSSLYQRQLPRDVLVVLELDGPAYREGLERVAKAANEVEAKNERGQGKKDADEMRDRETRRSSRLFAVDAGLDRAALRNKFPDRTKYAIVRGQVRPAGLPESKAAAGVIDNLSAAEVNVPLEMRSAFEGVAPDSDAGPNGGNKRFEVKLAFGQRLEPWLISAATK
jgi:hypothetical protein